jgi:ribonuclease BN (tRNA processing enzyme)
VIESTHIDIGRLFNAVVENKVRRVVLTHLTETYDGEEALAAAHKAGLDNVTLAVDGMRVEL